MGESSSDSEEEKKDEGGSDWRVELLKKMKDIKNLPPEELEAEFKKAMDEKRKKEQEEQCLNAIKERQKMARKVKKQAEKEAKKAEKLKAKEEKEEEASEDVFYGSGDGGFYNGFEDALGRMQSLQENNQLPDEVKENPFMSSSRAVQRWVGGWTASRERRPRGQRPEHISKGAAQGQGRQGKQLVQEVPGAAQGQAR